MNLYEKNLFQDIIALAKFIIRLISSVLHFCLIDLPLQLAGSIVLLVIIYCMPFSIQLPRWARWFDNADMYVGRDTSVYMKVIAQGKWARYCWLAWRNPLNYYGYVVKGLKFDGTEEYLNYDSSGEGVGDSSGKRPGLRLIEIKQHSTGKTFYEYYFIHKWSPTTCMRIRMGWKIVDKNNPAGSIAQQAFIIAPYKSYSGV